MQYQHITLKNVLAPKPTPYNYKVPVSPVVRGIFQVGYSINMYVLSGRKNSLWHSLLFCLNRDYQSTDLSWNQRNEMVDELLTKYKFKSTNDNKCINDAASQLGVNIILIDKLPYERISLFQCNNSNDFIVLQRDLDWFSVMVANDQLVYQSNNPIVIELCKRAVTVTEGSSKYKELMKLKAAELKELALTFVDSLPSKATKAVLCDIIINHS